MTYNFKSDEKVQSIEHCCVDCLTVNILDTFLHAREYEGINLISNADLITDVLRVLLNVEVDENEFTLGMVTLDGGEYEYGKEYILSINDNYEIWIEPLWRKINGEWTLFDIEGLVTFLDGDCDYKILKKLENDNQRVMIFDFEEDFEDEIKDTDFY